MTETKNKMKAEDFYTSDYKKLLNLPEDNGFYVDKIMGSGRYGRLMGVQIRFKDYSQKGRWNDIMRRVMVKNGEIDLDEFKKKYLEVHKKTERVNAEKDRQRKYEDDNREKSKELRKKLKVNEYSDAVKVHGKKVTVKLTMPQDALEVFMHAVSVFGIKIE